MNFHRVLTVTCFALAVSDASAANPVSRALQIAGCGAGEDVVSITILTDNFGSETSWTFDDTCTGDELLSGSNYGSTTEYQFNDCVEADGSYTFKIQDTFGDGICCSYGNGSYTVSVGDETETGGQFSYSETKTFGPGCGCEDFQGSYEGKDCAWVAQNPNSRCDLCSENGNVCAVDYCKQTCNSCDEVKLTASDGATGDWFGGSVAVSDETIVIGARFDGSGSAYVFTLNEEGNWIEQQKLTAPDGGEDESFGKSVAVYDETIVVSAYYDDDQGLSSGSVYIFRLNEEGNWYVQQKIIASDGAQSDYFGISVAVYDETIVVGAFGDDDQGSNSGSVYVFTRNEEDNWNEQQKLTASDAEAGGYFGTSVAVSDETIVVGERIKGDEFYNRGGSVYVFTLDGDGNWYEQQQLTASDGGQLVGGSYVNFGTSVAISDESIVVGAHNDDENGSDSGSAYVFTLNEGRNWYEQQKLIASDGAVNDSFGSSVAISDETIVVGASGDDDKGLSSGSVYVFTLNGEENWYEQKKLTAFDGAAFDTFGKSVAVSDETIVVGANFDDDNGDNSGSVYVY